MEKQNLITKAINIIGLNPLAAACSVTRQAIRRWEKSGRVPRSDFTHETNYGLIIETETAGKITRAELLNPDNISPTLS
ncbi:MAG: hypothetical protein ACI9N9_001199 [Enterobacterales bacterium]|jgi:hypothetical protein